MTTEQRLTEIRELLAIEDKTPGAVILLMAHMPWLMELVDKLRSEVQAYNILINDPN